MYSTKKILTSFQDGDILNQEEAKSFRENYKSSLEEHLTASKTYAPTRISSPGSGFMLNDKWSDMVWPMIVPPSVAGEESVSQPDIVFNPDTGVKLEILQEIGKRSVRIPDGFVSVHKQRGKVNFLFSLNLGDSFSSHAPCQASPRIIVSGKGNRLGNC